MLGDKAMKRMASSPVLLIGCDCLGVEVAKNLVLAGVKSLNIADNQVSSDADIEQNFFISREHVEQKITRADACVTSLAQLNPYVTVYASHADIYLREAESGCEESRQKLVGAISEVDCVIATQCSIVHQILIDEICREGDKSVKFVASNVHGLFSSVFCDFGDIFEVFDVNGEEPKEVLIESITCADPGVVKCLENTMHGFEDGDYVTFKEVKGMNNLNNQIRQIKCINPYSFSIADTSDLGNYQTGGRVKQVKIPLSVAHKSLRLQLGNPDLMVCDYGKLNHPSILHVGFQTLHHYKETVGSFPQSWNDKDATAFYEMAIEFIKKSSFEITVDETAERLLYLLSFTCRGILPPLAAMIGGIVAQEALKSITGKYTPLKQWLYLDAEELVEQIPESFEDRGSALAACLGNNAVEVLSRLKVFLVGCGAIGCEMMKNFALLGVATSENGQIVVTDNDFIEKSNLNRQFLFRSHDIQKSKSVVASNIIRKMREMIKIKALQLKVCPETESEIFNDSFFDNQDIVVNALDNIPARRYVDSRCVTNQKPLVESGTMGPKGHVQVIVPYISESYSSQNDPVEVQVPYCTLKSFPSQIEHTIQWARDKFESLFTTKPTIYNRFWEELREKHDKDTDAALKHLLSSLAAGDEVENASLCVKMLTKQPRNWHDCLAIARCLFEKNFNHKAQQLLHSFPLDTKMEDDSLFWSSPKRPPQPIVFNLSDPLHLQFVTSSAFLLASIHKIKPPENCDLNSVSAALVGVKVPSFVPSNKQIETDEEATKPSSSSKTSDSVSKLHDALVQFLCSRNESVCFNIIVEHFEKDDDQNHHINFISSAANLRAVMYGIETVDRLQVKRIAGQIIPAISTTTAAIAGFASLQFLQLGLQLQKKRAGRVEKSPESTSKYRNCFLNLALPLIVVSEPAPAQRTPITDKLSFTLWDRWEVKGRKDFTLTNLIEHFRSTFGLTVSSVIHGSRMVYVPIMPGHSKRLNQPLVKLIKMRNTSQKYVDLTLGLQNDDMGMDMDDLPCPPVRYYFGV